MQTLRYIAFAFVLAIGAVAGIGNSAFAALSAPTAVVMTSAGSLVNPTFTWVAPAAQSGVTSSYEVKVDASNYTDIGNATTYTSANALAEGTHTFYVRGKDASGTVGSEGSVTFTVDTTPPTVSMLSSSNATVNSSQNYNVTYSDSVGVTGCTLYVDGANKGDMTLSGSSGTAAMSLTLGNQGTYSFQAKCKDSAGNVGVGPVTTVTVAAATDTTVPTVGAVMSSNATVNTSQNVTVSYTDAAGVTGCNLYVNGVNQGAMSISNTNSGIASLNLSLSAPGTYTLYATCKDAAGNTGMGVTTTVTATGSAPTGTGGLITHTLAQLLADAQLIARADFTLAQSAVGSCELSQNTGLSRAMTVFKNFANESVRAQVAVFAACGSQTTKVLGAGERLGVVASYYAAFGSLPFTEAQWNDVTKIANGRFTSEISVNAEAAAKVRFRTIYLREPNMAQANDKAAIMIMAYGLRPLPRNLHSEAVAIVTYRAIFHAGPVTASQWDTVRAIAYSGARR